MKSFLGVIFALSLFFLVTGCPPADNNTGGGNDISGSATFTTSGGGDTSHDVKLAGFYVDYTMTTQVLNTNVVNLGKTPITSKDFTPLLISAPLRAFMMVT